MICAACEGCGVTVTSRQHHPQDISTLTALFARQEQHKHQNAKMRVHGASHMTRIQARIIWLDVVIRIRREFPNYPSVWKVLLKRLNRHTFVCRLLPFKLPLSTFFCNVVPARPSVQPLRQKSEGRSAASCVGSPALPARLTVTSVPSKALAAASRTSRRRT